MAMIMSLYDTVRLEMVFKTRLTPPDGGRLTTPQNSATQKRLIQINLRVCTTRFWADDGPLAVADALMPTALATAGAAPSKNCLGQTTCKTAPCH